MKSHSVLTHETENWDVNDCHFATDGPRAASTCTGPGDVLTEPNERSDDHESRDKHGASGAKHPNGARG